ncbi:MAG: beta-N-acetylhexosaminidase [Bacteroidota bacterium]
MIKLISIFTLTAFAVIPCFLSAKQEHHLNVIPTPQEVTLSAGQFRISSQTRIVLANAATAQDRFTADQLNEHLIGLGFSPLDVSEESRSRSRTSNFVYIGPPASTKGKALLAGGVSGFADAMLKEGYILSVTSEGVVILGESERGRYYGMMTLLQLIAKEKKAAVVPRVFIRDWPLQSIRGITDDLSRGQVSTQENFKAIIRYLSRHKLNVYSPYIEDIFVFKGHPLIGKGRGALLPNEVKELDSYAKRYHVELIPIFETLGHWENILLLPEYAHLAEFPGAHTINVSDERVYTLLDEMIGELAGAFSSPYFNMAADESWDVGLGASRDLVEKSDLASVHAEHYKKLFAMLAKHGKRPLMYGDIILNHPSILEKIPRDVIIVDWQYWAGQSYPSADIFRRAGFPFIVSPAIWNFTGPWPNFLNTVINVRNFSRAGYDNGALGILTSNWNDYGGETLRELNYYGFAWTAECAWQPLKADPVQFEQAFFSNFFGNAEAGQYAQAAYHLLSNVYTHLEWHEIWRHPLLPVRPSILNNLWRFQAIESSMPFVNDLLEKAAGRATLNKEHFRTVRFVTRLNLWFTQRIRARESIRDAQEDSTLNADEQAVAIRSVCSRMIAETEILKREFTDLWMRTNREDNLHLLVARYDRQIAYWNEISADPHMGDPSIPSAWLYHPRANPLKRDSTAEQVPRAWFRLTFRSDDAHTPGGIQLLADTYAGVFVNGIEVGTVFARRSLSLTVEQQRVKAWDLTPFLRPGKNVIAMESVTYDTFGSAGINILGYKTTPGGTTMMVVLDNHVKVSDHAAAGWKEADFDDSRWLPAAAKEVPYTVVAPDFSRNRLSWIER